jgi:hypothetical protein
MANGTFTEVPAGMDSTYSSEGDMSLPGEDATIRTSDISPSRGFTTLTFTVSVFSREKVLGLFETLALTPVESTFSLIWEWIAEVPTFEETVKRGR